MLQKVRVRVRVVFLKNQLVNLKLVKHWKAHWEFASLNFKWSIQVFMCNCSYSNAVSYRLSVDVDM